MIESKTGIIVSAGRIVQAIFVLRGHKVLLDEALAALYGVETRTLVQAVKRNLERFPADFLFQLSRQDLAILRSQSVISSLAHGGRRSTPYAFTEHGALMAGTVLNSPRAIEMSLYVVRAFVGLREMIAANNTLARKLDELEARIDKRLSTHDEAIAGILAAIRQLMAPPPAPSKRPIGFVTPDDRQRR